MTAEAPPVSESRRNRWLLVIPVLILVSLLTLFALARLGIVPALDGCVFASLPESENLQVVDLSIPRDEYGGATTLPCKNKTGNFHLEKIRTRWWLCTPAGNAFFKLGLMYVATDSAFDVKSKYGSANIWAAATIGRIKNWGFNALDTASKWQVQPIEGMNTVPLPFHK